MFDARNVLFQGIVGGLLGGSIVGVGEAVYLLASAQEVSDYQPLVYAAVLYGGLGLVLGCATTFAAQLVCAPLRRPLPPHRLLALSLLSAVCVLGFFVVVSVLRMDQYRGSWPTTETLAAIAACFVVIAGGIYVVGSGLLERTMARALLEPSSGIGVYAGLVVFLLLMHVGSGQLKVESAPGSPAAQGGVERSNVLLIIVESLRADQLGCYGNADGLTPHIDAFASRAVVYEEAIAQSSATRASFASILTSVIPSSHGVVGAAGRLPDELATLAEVMDGAGYTAGARVTHEGVGDRWGFDQGYDDFEHLHRAHPLWASDRSSSLVAYSALTRWVVGRLAGQGRRVAAYYRNAAEVTDAAISYLDDHRDQRWFLTVQFMDPHDPYFQHPWDGRAVGRTDGLDPVDADRVRAAYRGEVSYLDAHLGRLLDAITGEGVEEDTIVVLTSSHGVEFQEHGGWWHGATLYEEQIWVPLIVRYPDGFTYVAGTLTESPSDEPLYVANGDRAVDLVRLIDIAPTLVLLAGHSAPEEWQGAPLTGDWTRRDILDKLAFSETEFEGNVLSSLRSSSWKLIEDEPGGTRPSPACELFDLRSDPAERTDLCDSEVTAAIRDRAHEQLAAIRIHARGEAKPGEIRRLDPATCRQLRELGYLEPEFDCEQ